VQEIECNETINGARGRSCSNSLPESVSELEGFVGPRAAAYAWPGNIRECRMRSNEPSSRATATLSRTYKTRRTIWSTRF